MFLPSNRFRKRVCAIGTLRLRARSQATVECGAIDKRSTKFVKCSAGALNCIVSVELNPLIVLRPSEVEMAKRSILPLTLAVSLLATLIVSPLPLMPTVKFDRTTSRLLARQFRPSSGSLREFPIFRN